MYYNIIFKSRKAQNLYLFIYCFEKSVNNYHCLVDSLLNWSVQF